jgi:hypothetical protein
MYRLPQRGPDEKGVEYEMQGYNERYCESDKM